MMDTLGPSSLNGRQERILEQTASQGFVTIENLAKEFDVSAQTVRRDIIMLSEAGLLQRFHGGAGIIGSDEALRLDYDRKTEISRDDKSRVARAAALLVGDHATVFLDVGTTVEALAQELNNRPGFRVFTNSTRAALHFDPHRHEIMVLGGRLAGRDGSLVGEEIVLTLSNLKIDVAFLGCSAIDDAGRVMDYDLSKIAVKKVAIASASEKFLLASPSKFGRSALAAFANVTDFDKVVDGT
uniref:DeoR/GlpR family DNA-binding transcription regulator n=1 Tax=Pararhizobium sp. IMCC3301 TaxID=3067904 RepID=UPI002741D129|nr:DeoR/GlpR family DNA-binding transcription regulator [Pararhizobium sp. IMCC3301]